MTSVIIFTIVATIIIYQLICTIAGLIDEDYVIWVACGLFVIVLNFFNVIGKRIRKFKNRKYNKYEFYDIKYSWGDDIQFSGRWFMTEEVANNFFIRIYNKDEEVTKEYSIRLNRDGKKDPFPFKIYDSDILTEEKILNGTLGGSAEYFEKFRK